MYLLESLTNLLPVGARPYAKAVFPTIIALVAIATSWATTGTFNEGELRATLAAGLNALIIYGVVNRGNRVSAVGSKTV